MDSPAPMHDSAENGGMDAQDGHGDTGLEFQAADALEDQRCFLRTLQAFRSYGQQATLFLDHRQACYNALPEKHKQLIGKDLNASVFAPYKLCVEANSRFLEELCHGGFALSLNYWPDGIPKSVLDETHIPSPMDIDKVFSTLKQCVRDWSEIGKTERDCVYTPILSALTQWFPDPGSRLSVHVLLPGSGLSRLALEVALLGFSAQANEFSYHMLICGHYLLNHVEKKLQYRIFPYVDTTVNLLSRQHQFLAVDIPDCSPVERIQEEGVTFGDMSMIAGDFTEVYSKPKELGAWQAVCTCFFIDTAHDIVEYMRMIYDLLAPGGLWINVGPLLYHFADTTADSSVELALDEVLQVARNIGFIVHQEGFLNTTYTANPYSMKQMVYRCSMFTASKPMTASAT